VINILLILQIIIIILIVLALTRPFFVAEGSAGRFACLIVDRSASMSTMEEGGTRLELAKAAAIDLVDTIEDGKKMMVVSFAEKADVLCELTDDRSRLRQAIKSIEPSEGRGNIRDVMMIARSMASDNPDVPSVVQNLELILISDGKITDIDRIGERIISMTYLQVGKTDDNAGIVQFSARRSEDSEEGERQAFVVVHNESGDTLESTVTLSYDGQALTVEEVKAGPGESADVLFELSHLESGLLMVELDHEDALAIDNAAWLSLRPRIRIKVLVVSDPESYGAFFIKHALVIDPRVDLATITPDNYIDSGEHDLTIFYNWAPPALPEGTMVFFNVVPPVEGVEAAGTLDRPPILNTDRDHPAMRYLSPGAVMIDRALKLRLPPGARTLISTRQWPLAADVSRGGRQILIVAFDIAESNWPLNLSFPLFIQNILSWTPRTAMSGEESSPTGRALAIMPDQTAETAKVTLPGGEEREIELDPLRPVFFSETDSVGPYYIERGDEVMVHAVNLLNFNETSISPVASLKLGRGEVEGQTGRVKRNREMWRWLILAALAFLAVEWWIYSRRAWI